MSSALLLCGFAQASKHVHKYLVQPLQQIFLPARAGAAINRRLSVKGGGGESYKVMKGVGEAPQNNIF